MTDSDNRGRRDERRRKTDALLASLTLPPEGASPEEPPNTADAYWMGAALSLAEAAAEEGEVPVGCVIVRGGRLLAADYNGRETFRDAVYHAETAAISEACRKLGGWRLPGCTMYVTLEPCPMCAGAIWNARLPRVVVGAKDPKAGALGSLLNLNAYPLNFHPSVVFGVREAECRALLRAFFERKRK